MAKQTKQIGFRGTVEYRRQLQQAAHDREIKVQQLIERALDAYLGKAGEIQEAPKMGGGIDHGFGELADEERRIVLAVLDFLRDDTVPDRFEGILECFLKDYLREGKGRQGKKRA